MNQPEITNNSALFSEVLFAKMKLICPVLVDLEMYEFNYCMENVVPEAGWDTIKLDSTSDIEKKINDFSFYKGIQINQKANGNILLDDQISGLTRMLFVGLVTDAYLPEWIDANFYFDPRGFFFLARTRYFTEKVLAHLGGKPYAAFTPKQREFDHFNAVGYRQFKEANREVDE